MACNSASKRSDWDYQWWVDYITPSGYVWQRPALSKHHAQEIARELRREGLAGVKVCKKLSPFARGNAQ